jgi:hypothetical protein
MKESLEASTNEKKPSVLHHNNRKDTSRASQNQQGHHPTLSEIQKCKYVSKTLQGKIFQKKASGGPANPGLSRKSFPQDSFLPFKLAKLLQP